MVETIDKKWGKELIIHNDSDYCGKIIYFNSGGKFSMHFHASKKETWYVNSGSLLYSWIDTYTANKYEKIIYAGEIIEIKRLLPHQLEALETSIIFEVSTQDFNDDSYRIEKGDNQL
jgi:mannose-6-phosphate isomerase-like protein (cupin superfamily)